MIGLDSNKNTPFFPEKGIFRELLKYSSNVRRPRKNVVCYYLSPNVGPGGKMNKLAKAKLYALGTQYVADALGVGVRSINNWASGVNIPLARREKLAEILGCSVGDFTPAKKRGAK